MASSATSCGQLWLGLATLIALGLATLAFGFTHVGRFCLVVIFILPVTRALRKGMFHFVMGRHSLVRTEDPLGFWTVVVIHLTLASVALFYLLNGIWS